jgi:hypothetical protein
MQRYRYTGPDASRDLAIPGAAIRFPRMRWVDPEKAAADANVDPRHLSIILAGLGEDWEAEGPKKAAATHRRNAQADTEPRGPRARGG